MVVWIVGLSGAILLSGIAWDKLRPRLVKNNHL
jgi:hypothetical protein